MSVSVANGGVGWAFTTLGSAVAWTQSGKIKFIAIASMDRLKTLPDVPTIEEAGGPPGFEVGSWLALVAPRGTPPDVIRRINADVNRVLGDPDVQLQLKSFGFEGAPGTPEQLAETIRIEAKKFGEVVRRTGASAD